MTDPNPIQIQGLCFRTAPDDLPRLAALEQLVGGSFQRVSNERSSGRAFDTSARQLAGEGIELWVERLEDGIVQTVCATAARHGGVHERTLWRTSLSSEAPEPQRIADPEIRHRISELLGEGDLEPQLLSREWRRQSEIETGSSRVRVTLRLGVVGEPAATRPFARAEFELLWGDLADLYELAGRVNERVPLQIELSTLGELGFAVVDGARPGPVRARRVHLPDRARLESALAASLTSGLDQIAANADAVRDGRDPEGVHQMRVGARRTRSALSLFKRLLPPGPVEDLKEGLSWLGNHLGPARDLDVFIDELLDPVIAANPHDPALIRLRALAEEARHEARDNARSAVDSPRATAVLLELGGFIARRGWRDQPLSPASARLFARARPASRRLLSRRHRRLQRSAAAVEISDRHSVHAMRIEVKKLRYAVEFLGSLHDGASRRRFSKRLGRLQTILGRFNDAEVARRLLAELVTTLGEEAKPELHTAAGLVAGWAARDAETQLVRLDHEWRAFDDTTPFWKKGTKHS
ncbi:MAG: CHAD domain-containing protein [Myxococcota bacterium]